MVYCSKITITMADAILLRIQGTRSAAYPLRYVSNEQRRRQKKSFSPKGISSLVNLFLSLRLRTTKGTLRSKLRSAQVTSAQGTSEEVNNERMDDGMI